MPRIIIVGAGISGLTVAWRLQQALPEAGITLLEMGSRPGGTLWTDRLAGFQIETGPNGFLDTKPATLALCRELGLGDCLVAASPAAARNRYLFLNGRLHLLPNSLGSFLTSKLLSWRGKVSLLWERFRRSRPPAEDESIDAFARRRAGNEVADLLADALVTGIYAGDPKLLSLPAAFPRLAALEKEHGSILRGLARSARQRRAEARARGVPYQRPGRLWSFRQGLRLLVETLAGRLARPPVLNVPIRRVQRQQETGASSSRRPIWVVSSQEQSWLAEAVILTCPAHQQAVLLHELDHALAEQVGAIPYNRVVVIALGYRRSEVPIPIEGFGFIAPQKFRRDILGVQWCSSIYPERAPRDMVLLRVLAGGWHRPEVATWEEERLLAAVRAELRLAMGISAAPLFTHIVRWERAIPQYHLGHLERVRWIEQRLAEHPGLFLGGNAYRGVAINDCTEQGAILAERVRDYVQGASAG